MDAEPCPNRAVVTAAEPPVSGSTPRHARHRPHPGADPSGNASGQASGQERARAPSRMGNFRALSVPGVTSTSPGSRSTGRSYERAVGGRSVQIARPSRGSCALHDPLIAFACLVTAAGTARQWGERSGRWLGTDQWREHVGLVPETLNRPRTDPGDPFQLLDRGVRAVELSIADDAPGQDRTDPGQRLEFLGTRLVQIDAPEAGWLDRLEYTDRAIRDTRLQEREITRGGSRITLRHSGLRYRRSRDSPEPWLDPVAHRPEEEKKHHQPDEPALAFSRGESLDQDASKKTEEAGNRGHERCQGGGRSRVQAPEPAVSRRIASEGRRDSSDPSRGSSRRRSPDRRPPADSGGRSCCGS